MFIRPMYVFLMDGAPLAKEWFQHCYYARKIWQKAGIQFDPISKPVGQKTTENLIGKQKKLFMPDSLQWHKEPNYKYRRNLFLLKPHPYSLSVFLSIWICQLPLMVAAFSKSTSAEIFSALQ